METKLIQLFPEKENSEKTLQVSGELFMSGCSLFGTEVNLFENDILQNKFICCANGYFYFQLKYNKNYIIEVSKENYESKRININTNLNNSEILNRHFEFGVALHKKTDGTSSENKNTPLIYYSSEFDRFEIVTYSKTNTNIAI
jgi:hypothetical protein